MNFLKMYLDFVIGVNTNSCALLGRIDNLANKTYNCFGGVFNMDDPKETINTIAVDFYDYISANTISIVINSIILILMFEDQDLNMIIFVNCIITLLVLIIFIILKDEVKIYDINFSKYSTLFFISIIVQIFITQFFWLIFALSKI